LSMAIEMIEKVHLGGERVFFIYAGAEGAILTDGTNDVWLTRM
jgi:hypothetical protein